MDKTYNSQYYIDIFKFLLEKKIKRSLNDPSFSAIWGDKYQNFKFNTSIFQNEISIFPVKNNKTKYFNKNKLSSESFEYKNKQINSSRNLLKENNNLPIIDKIEKMKKFKEDKLLEKNKKINENIMKREEKFKRNLKNSQDNLSNKIKQIKDKREFFFSKFMEKKLIINKENDDLLLEKLLEIERSREKNKNPIKSLRTKAISHHI